MRRIILFRLNLVQCRPLEMRNSLYHGNKIYAKDLLRLFIKLSTNHSTWLDCTIWYAPVCNLSGRWTPFARSLIASSKLSAQRNQAFEATRATTRRVSVRRNRAICSAIEDSSSLGPNNAFFFVSRVAIRLRSGILFVADKSNLSERKACKIRSYVYVTEAVAVQHCFAAFRTPSQPWYRWLKTVPRWMAMNRFVKFVCISFEFGIAISDFFHRKSMVVLFVYIVHLKRKQLYTKMQKIKKSKPSPQQFTEHSLW